MKYRTDFVTNSSSSSYIVAKIKSSFLVQIFLKCKEVSEEVLKVNKYNINDDVISIESNDFINMPLPTNLTGVIDSFITVFEENLEYKEEDLEYCKRHENLNYAVPEYEKTIKELKELIELLKSNKNKIVRNISNVDWLYGNFERDGECSLKYRLENYSYDHLQKMLRNIAKKYNCKINQITDDMIQEYIWDKSFTQEIHYVYDKEHKINKSTYRTKFGGR